MSYRRHAAARRIAALLVISVIAGGVAARSIRLLDLAGREVDPFAGTGRIAVFIFVGIECPIANRYAPELQRLASSFGARGVAFRLVYPDPEASTARIAAHMREYGHSTVALRDPGHDFARLTGATVIPEAAVFDGRRLVYRGRIDDRFVRLGAARPAPSVRDVEQVLDDLLAGRTIALFTRPAVGCLIAEVP